MDSERQPSLRSGNGPWNKGRLIGQKRPLKPKEVWTIRVRLQLEHHKRDLALFNLAIDSKLRGCDLVGCNSLIFASAATFGTAPPSSSRRPAGPSSLRSPNKPEQRSRLAVEPRTWKRPIPLPELSPQPAAPLDATVCSDCPSLGRRAGLDSSAYGTHSMRRTKAAQIYKKTGNLRAVQLLLGHTKLESTVRYLGIEVDDALSISEQVEL